MYLVSYSFILTDMFPKTTVNLGYVSKYEPQ